MARRRLLFSRQVEDLQRFLGAPACYRRQENTEKAPALFSVMAKNTRRDEHVGRLIVCGELVAWTPREDTSVRLRGGSVSVFMVAGNRAQAL